MQENAVSASLAFGEMPAQKAAKGDALRQDGYGWKHLGGGKFLLKLPQDSIVVADQGSTVGKSIGDQSGKCVIVRFASADTPGSDRIIPGNMPVRNWNADLLHCFHESKIALLGSAVIGLKKGTDTHMTLGKQLLYQSAAAIIIIIGDTGNLRKFRAGGKQKHDMTAFLDQKTVQIPVGIGKGTFDGLQKKASWRRA